MSKKVHIIGIGGTGMSAIALMLLEKGYQVSGSDMNASDYFQRVTEQGTQTVLGHDPALAISADMVLRSSAIRDDDPEVSAAMAAGVPVLKRSEFLQELIGDQITLAIAGSHGKTTTSAMLITLLQALGEDPSFILGAKLKELGTNARVGMGKYFVIEADEYDRMFLGLAPEVSLITNLEHDHPDCFPTFQDYTQAFADFIGRTVPGGKVVYCGDDPALQDLVGQVAESKADFFSYGSKGDADYHIKDALWTGNGHEFTLSFRGEPLGVFHLSMPGRHNVLNAAGALAVIHQLGLEMSLAERALARFSGSDRRFDLVYDTGGVHVINDYGHHPTQVRATLQAARESFPEASLWAVWEPHTYSRTHALKDDFIAAFKLADQVRVARIYAAREADDGSSPQPIADALQNALYFPQDADLVADLAANLHGNDVVVVLSAGRGPQISQMLIDALQAKGDTL